ncbi:MAG TPA: OmpA family protein [Candidatus Kapabacteria bacterium]|nr:OmpA family protein [Candidatus Kapabacteria bacterium]
MRNRYLISIHSLGIFLVASAVAQSTTEPTHEVLTVGAYGGYAFNILRSAFAVDKTGQVVGSDDCGRFERGTGTAPLFGVAAELPLDGRFRAGLRAEYQQRGGTLRFGCVDPATTRLPDGSVVVALTDHVADVRFATLTTKLLLGYRPGNFPLQVDAGPAVAFVLPSPAYNAWEEIVAPSSAEFVTGGQVRPYGNGPFNNGVHVAAGIAADLSWRAPIGQRLSLVPEVGGMLSLTNDVPEAALRSHDIHASLGLFYRFDRSPEPVPVPIAVAEPPREQVPTLDIGLTANVKLPDGRLTDTLVVQQTGLVSSKLYPLLTYLFFDEANAAIPQRYVRRTPEATRAFSEDNLRTLNTLGIYYNLLDIIGLRMTRHASATVTVTGTQPDVPVSEKLALATQRAENVKAYLVDTWKIDPARITVAARTEPQARSNPETREGAAENRRVEISSGTYEITEPVLLADTSAENVAPPAWLASRVSAESGIDTWTIVVSGGRKHDAIFAGSGMPPAHLELPQTFIDEAAATRPPQFGMSLTVRDLAGEQVTDSTTLPLRWENHLSDIRFGTGSYSLILFDFNSAQLRPEHLRTLDLVNARADSTSHAGVYGYTDVLGSDELNKTLSEQRASSVAGRLRSHVDEVIGRGETTQLYDNTLPEGRFYSRTVMIETKTP